jgi:hypothetical protein
MMGSYSPLVPAMGAKIKFEFRKQEGAMLCLQRPTWMQAVRNDAIMRHYAATYALDWLQSIKRSMFLLDVDLEDLLFVTGLVKASDFETVTLRASSFEHSVDLQIAPYGGLELSVGCSSSHECSLCPVHAKGPRPYWDSESKVPASAANILQGSTENESKIGDTDPSAGTSALGLECSRVGT